MFQPYDDRALVLREPKAPMPVTDFLRGARQRIADPLHWCQAMLRRHDRSGETLAECSVGAIDGHFLALRPSAGSDWVALDWLIHDAHAARLYLDRAAESIIGVVPKRFRVGHSFATFLNDSRSHAGVMAMWDKAIAMAEKAGA